MYEEDHIEPDFMKRTKKNPFRTPEGYFDSIEDRIIGRIELPVKSKTTSARIITFLKPALGLAASLLLVGLLVYSPIKTLLLKNGSKTELAQSSTTDLLENYTFDIGSIDDNTLADVLFSDETSEVSLTNTDELLAYLSSDLNELEIYSEIQNY